jgi:signal transduction histidine kinase
MAADSGVFARPSRLTSLAVSAALVVVWVGLRLVVFETTLVPLTYAIPLLACVWTRDRAALWAMAAIFAVAHGVKIFWLMPAGQISGLDLWTNLAATFSNIGIGALAVHAIIRLREHLEQALAEVRAQADVLRVQSEELAGRNEELSQQAERLSRQNDELSRQGKELASQNEALQSQTEEIGALNVALARRERLLEVLFETARMSGPEQAALDHLATAATELFDDPTAVAVIYDTSRGVPQAVAWADADGPGGATLDPRPGLAVVVAAEQRTAALDDADQRPDLALPGRPEGPRLRAALCAPVRVAGAPCGAFAIHVVEPRNWSREEFRLIEWLAGQCGRVLETLRIQHDLRQAEQRKNDFLATLSHELRNPLAPMHYALEVLDRGGTVNLAAMTTVRRQFRHLIRVVDDVLDATRLSSNKIQVRPARVDLVPIVRHAAEALRPEVEAAGHTFAIHLPDSPVWVDADADRMAQVVANIVGNAARYTPAGGRVDVVVDAVADGVAVSVSDTGVGLQASDLDRVFEMFTQVGGPGSGGLGIGLAIVKGIVERHGGRVDAASDGPGAGSRFRVLLPIAEAPAQAVNGTPTPLTGTARRVLVVDDNVDAATTMGLLLEMHGHTVCIAHDAQGALEAARASPPDVALLDIGLPDLDGYELARQLRQHDATHRMRLIAVTGWGQEHDRTRARDAGFDAHLTKPAEPDAVLGVL